MEHSFQQQALAYLGLPEGAMAQMAAFFQPLELPKGGYLLRAGQVCDCLAFVEAGWIREYWTEESGREITKWVAASGGFVTDLASFLFQRPARWNLQALSDCRLIALSRSDYGRIGKAIPEWKELESLFLARCFTVLEDRVVALLSLDAEARYRQLYAWNRTLFTQVPQQYLASLLGMTPETFSRIRRKLAREA